MNLHDFYALYKKWFDKREDSVVRENRTTDKKEEDIEINHQNGRK